MRNGNMEHIQCWKFSPDFFSSNDHCTGEPSDWRPVCSKVQCTFHLQFSEMVCFKSCKSTSGFVLIADRSSMHWLSTLTSASRAAHLTWVEDRLSAHLCPPGAQLFSAWAQPPLSDHLPSSDSQLSDYSAFHIIIVQQRRGASNGDSNLTHTK